jgi:undecaprenyl-diphosphatase
MIPVWQAIVLGVIQGLGEFLPISSSAHLTLAPWFFGWNDPGLAFDVALHWGTLAAVVFVFWRDWIRLIGAGLNPAKRGTADFRIFWALVVSSIPAAIVGKLLDKWAEENLRAPLLIAATLAVMGVLLWLADRAGRKSDDLDRMTPGRALLIGVGQAAALVPGVSRSGATITIGLAQGFAREPIARFSFLMSTPIILGAGLLKFPKMLHEMHAGTSPVTWGGLTAGFIAAAITGIIVIKWILDYLRRRTYAVFAIYRLFIAAVVCLAWLSGRR